MIITEEIEKLGKKFIRKVSDRGKKLRLVGTDYTYSEVVYLAEFSDGKEFEETDIDIPKKPDDVRN